MRNAFSRVRIAGVGALLLSAVVAGVGTALPWLSVTPVSHGSRALAERDAVAFPGIVYGNGLYVVLAALLLALVAVLAVVRGHAWQDWLVLVGVVVGALALGHWVATLNQGGNQVPPAGVVVSVAGILLATPAAALLHRGRVRARLVIAAATLFATAVPFLSGGILYGFAPISVYPVF